MSVQTTVLKVWQMPRKLDPKSKTKPFQLVAPQAWFDLVDDWRSRRRPMPNVSEAIRQMVQAFAESERSKRKDGK